MKKIYRDERLAEIFNAFAEGENDRAKDLLVTLTLQHGDDPHIANPVLAVLDHLAFRDSGRIVADFAWELAEVLPENPLRTKIEDKARELAEKLGAQAGQERRRTMTPDEFTAKLGYTPFKPAR